MVKAAQLGEIRDNLELELPTEKVKKQRHKYNLFDVAHGSAARSGGAR
jgi:hypothetical protein